MGNKSHSAGFGILGRISPETNHSRQIFNTYCSGQAQNSIVVKFKSIICQAQYSYSGWCCVVQIAKSVPMWATGLVQNRKLPYRRTPVTEHCPTKILQQPYKEHFRWDCGFISAKSLQWITKWPGLEETLKAISFLPLVPVAPSSTQLGLEHFQGWGNHNFSGQMKKDINTFLIQWPWSE